MRRRRAWRKGAGIGEGIFGGEGLGNWGLDLLDVDVIVRRCLSIPGFGGILHGEGLEFLKSTRSHDDVYYSSRKNQTKDTRVQNWRCVYL
jgi:hypothetical protein